MKLDGSLFVCGAIAGAVAGALVLPGLFKPSHAAAHSAEYCGSFRHQQLTSAQRFPLIPSGSDWIRAAFATLYMDHFVFDEDLSMCRYDEERGCWVPMVGEQHKCTPDEIKQANAMKERE